MLEQYKHLIIEKEPLENPRRSHKVSMKPVLREDIQTHKLKLETDLLYAVEQSQMQNVSKPGNFVLKLRYEGYLDPQHLKKHGVEFISQEDKHVCAVFADDDGRKQFLENINKLGLENSDITYKILLESLIGIDNWTIDDRTSWALKNKGFPTTELFKLDVELWPFHYQSHPERIELCTRFEKWMYNNQIINLDKVNLDGFLMYRLELSKAQANMILNHQDVRQVNLTPQTGLNYKHFNVNLASVPVNLPSPSIDSARICILDSGINASHPLLATSMAEGVSYIKGRDSTDDVGHGTAIAGIIQYGDVEKCIETNTWEPKFWLYNGKIMFRDERTGDACFDNKTIINIVMNAIEYFTVECGCRIFNLSIGDINSPFDGKHIRGLAYALDMMVRKHNIFISVSAGNFTGSDDPLIPTRNWLEEYPDYLMHNSSIIIDPAPALNVVTVGSIVRHTANINEQREPQNIHALPPAQENQPSPFTRHGPSIRGAIKPDLVDIGGNISSIVRSPSQYQTNARGLGVLTLHHNFIGNTLLTEDSGTSFSTAYVTHLAGRLLNEYPHLSANMLRAVLTNHANIPEECKNTFSEDARKKYKTNTKTKNRDLVIEVVGYGKVDEDVLYRSTENSVVLMAEDSIENNTHQFYELPLPSNFLRSNRAIREIRVAMAYSPPVLTSRQDYIATRINFRLVKGKSLKEVQKYFNNDTKDETDSRTDDAVGNRNISSHLRERGTLQSSIWRCKQLKPDEKWFVVITRQDQGWGANLCLELESYALTITLTDLDNLEAKLYSEVSLRIREQTQARVKV